MQVRLIVSPYDSGQKLKRMGRGPDRLLGEGLAAALAADGHSVELRRIDLGEAFPSEIAVGFAAMRAVAEEVRVARDAGALPVILGGNCNTTVGAVAGLGCAEAGVLWLDAHGDINTPDTSQSGFLDGMGVAILTGRAWSALAHSIPGFAALPDERVVLAGIPATWTAKRQRCWPTPPSPWSRPRILVRPAQRRRSRLRWPPWPDGSAPCTCIWTSTSMTPAWRPPITSVHRAGSHRIRSAPSSMPPWRACRSDRWPSRPTIPRLIRRA